MTGPGVRAWAGTVALIAIAGTLLLAYGACARHGPALADEHIYLAGARHFAQTGGLGARYYDADAILKQGHPHQDAHSPGFVLILGALMAVVHGAYWTAVGLNAVCYVTSALLVRSLARSLGLDGPRAWTAAALYLTLPVFLPYVFWVMSEIVLATLLLASLAVAAKHGTNLAGSVAAGLFFGAALLVRETAVFGLPAVLGLLWKRGRPAPFLGSLAAFVLLLYLPLNAHRAGGAAIWRLPWGAESGLEVATAAGRADLVRAASLGLEHVRWNLDALAQAPGAERGVLGCYTLIVLVGLLGWRRQTETARPLLAGLTLGWLALTGVLLSLYSITSWDGFRFLMTLMPAALPPLVSALAGADDRMRRLWVLGGIALLGLAVDGATLRLVNVYKTSRQARQQQLADYLDRQLPGPLVRVAVVNGWLFGLRRYPVEVISSLPERASEIRALERAVWFDYLVLPPDSSLAAKLEGRLHYRLLNDGDAGAPVRIYRRQP